MPVHVLVVDDDEMSRELLALLLEAEGYSVESADSGESALASLRSSTGSPDLILSDMQMPGTTGSELAIELRALSGSSTVLLAMSGSEPAAEAVSQFDGFLLKPFNMQQFAEAVERAQPQRVQTGPPRLLSSSSKVIPISSTPLDLSASASVTPPVEPSGAASPVVNEKIYGQLARTMPSRQLNEMYTLCLNDARERIRRMRRSAEQQDSAAFVREAHAIKGGAGMLGATQIHTMASDLESRGLPSSPEAVSAVNSLDELAAACDRLERMLGTRA